MPPTRVQIRPPLAARAYVVVFLLVWCGLLLTGAVRAASRSPAALVPFVVMLAFGATIGYRLFTLSVVAEGDQLVVHNNRRTYRWRRDEVETFLEGRGTGLPRGATLQVLLRDQTTVTLDVTQTVLPGRRSRERLEERLEQLRAWRGSSAPPGARTRGQRRR